jgi:hypothetical protein
VKTCGVVWHWLQRELWCGSGKSGSWLVLGNQSTEFQLVVLMWHIEHSKG